MTNTFSLMEFRERFPFKPYQRVMYQGREMEAISYPWPNGDGAAINIREPDDPTALVTVDCAELDRICECGHAESEHSRACAMSCDRCSCDCFHGVEG